MTPRAAWIFAWMWLVMAIVIAVLGRPRLGGVWLVFAGVSFWIALRRGSRPWRRNADGRFPD